MPVRRPAAVSFLLLHLSTGQPPSFSSDAGLGEAENGGSHRHLTFHAAGWWPCPSNARVLDCNGVVHNGSSSSFRPAERSSAKEVLCRVNWMRKLVAGRTIAKHVAAFHARNRNALQDDVNALQDDDDPFLPVLNECVICMDKTECIATAECGNVVCHGCVRDYVQLVVLTKPAKEPKVMCPCNCGGQLPWTHVTESLTQESMNGLMVHLTKPAPVIAIGPPPSDVTTIVDTLKTESRKRLEEAATLCTPCCGAAVLDFDACFAVHCHFCERWFCAYCLTYHDSNSRVCHDHVKICAENPDKGQYYGDAHWWAKEHVPRVKRSRVHSVASELRAQVKSVLPAINDARDAASALPAAGADGDAPQEEEE